MAYPTTFAAVTQATGAQLDDNFNVAGKLGVIPCTVTGTNALTLTPIPDVGPSITAYSNYLQFSGVVGTTNTTGVTAQVGALAVLNVYKDSPAGPVALTGGEMIANTMFTLHYDSALNTGAGGFHLFNSTGYAGGTISGPLYINNNLTVASLASVTRLMVGASAASITRILSAAATLTFTVVPANTTQMQTLAVSGAQVNDAVQVGPPASVVVGTSFMGHVLASGTVGVTAINPTAASLTPITGIYRVAVTGFT